MTIADRFPTSASAGPPTPEQRRASEQLRDRTIEAARAVDEHVPPGRWQSLALTALEEALMWANKGLFNEKREGSDG